MHLLIFTISPLKMALPAVIWANPKSISITITSTFIHIVSEDLKCSYDRSPSGNCKPIKGRIRVLILVPPHNSGPCPITSICTDSFPLFFACALYIQLALSYLTFICLLTLSIWCGIPFLSSPNSINLNLISSHWKL